ncbi:MAG: DNA recombination protein RmuC [Ignavibacteria bacterium]|nr:DNA recombination protein RmuC [Ignavibacteria bacterium]MBT8393124.1 DNA recombination protein RmuC [Ignavibacteria bacterium]NNJ53394.1 DNA recombination protein RmuC [Ignavibacteriaceae bacterium]NNL20819.1 DNA recombination protein RmuC [Ignavibacteriaceae bacterium]
MELLYLLVGLVVGAIAAWFIASFKYKGEVSRVAERTKILEQDKEVIEAELKSERENVLELNSKLSSLQSNYSNLQEKLAEQKGELEKLQKKFTKEFENLANKIFEEKTTKFSEQSKANLSEILNPLKERITEFQTKVEETNKDSISRTAALREQLQALKDMNQQMSSDAQNLVKALKGDTKTQGDWGEIQLERILERSGLRKGEEYSIQESFTVDDGKRKRPDVIINLPEEKKIIIDSKLSLVSYERFVSADEDNERNIHLKAFIDSVKRHIKDLSDKNYQTIFESDSLDFVLMFIPIEPAFSLAIQYGENLYVDAYDKNIIIVSPSTLLATLRTIANIWKQEYQNQNVLEIAKQSGALYDKFVGFINDLKSVGERMDQTKSSYVAAMNKLVDGSGNLVKRAEKIKELGAKTSKSLPQSILNRAIEDSEEK